MVVGHERVVLQRPLRIVEPAGGDGRVVIVGVQAVMHPGVGGVMVLGEELFVLHRPVWAVRVTLGHGRFVRLGECAVMHVRGCGVVTR